MALFGIACEVFNACGSHVGAGARKPPAPAPSAHTRAESNLLSVLLSVTRATAGPQAGPITPQAVRGDRGNEPAHNNLFAAIVFHELSIATGKALWAAKAEALATAVLQSIDPKTGYFNHVWRRTCSTTIGRRER